MIFTFEITVPKNTRAATPVNFIRELPVGGIISGIDITIPDGHRGLARLKISSRGSVIVPALGSNPDYLRGNNTELHYQPNKKLDGPEWSLTFTGYNLDATFEHTFFISVVVVNG